MVKIHFLPFQKWLKNQLLYRGKKYLKMPFSASKTDRVLPRLKIFCFFSPTENKATVGSASDSSTQSHVVMERLPNGWSKKAVKRLSGTSKGKKNTMLLVAFSTKKKKRF